jgi:hypothetical protein
VFSMYSQKPADVIRDKPNSGNDNSGMTSYEKIAGTNRSDRCARLSYHLLSFVVTIMAYTNYYTVQPTKKNIGCQRRWSPKPENAAILK